MEVLLTVPYRCTLCIILSTCIFELEVFDLPYYVPCTLFWMHFHIVKAAYEQRTTEEGMA